MNGNSTNGTRSIAATCGFRAVCSRGGDENMRAEMRRIAKPSATAIGKKLWRNRSRMTQLR
jgi:hypothetical protein